jgi:carbon monoxide dehydrogenase subunit G
MVHIEESVTIEKPVEEVFKFLTDVERQPDWVGPIQSSKITSSGPLGEGSTVQQAMKVLGRRFDATLEITGYQPPNRYEFKGKSGPMHVHFRFALTPEGNGTRVRQTVDGESSGFFKLADPIISRNMSKQFQADLETMKTMLESGVEEEGTVT